MTKAENIFRATRHAALDIIEHHGAHPLTDHWRLSGWCYGKTPEGQQFMSQRTLNDVRKLIAKEQRRLDMSAKYGIEIDPKWHEALRVLKDMAYETQGELDRERQERADRKRMGYDEWMAKYYPQYC